MEMRHLQLVKADMHLWIPRLSHTPACHDCHHPPLPRSVDRGIYDDFELWTPRGSVHVVMLDERSWRSTMPCYIRREWCRKVMVRGGGGWLRRGSPCGCKG